MSENSTGQCSLADILYRRHVKNQIFLFELQYSMYTLILELLGSYSLLHSSSWKDSYIGNK